ncbi:MAG: RluA family pseudouridine synthase [Patescibacteria group bacterium]
MNTSYTYKIPKAYSGERADKVVRAALKRKGLWENDFTGRTFLTALFEAGQVSVLDTPIDASKRLRSGETIQFNLPDEEDKKRAKDTPRFLPEKLYENEHFLVFNKPAFMSMHGGVGIRQNDYTFADFLRDSYTEVAGIGESVERPGIVHRLDKNTSGVVLIAKTQEAYTGLKELFLERKIHKTYVALCYGVFKEVEGSITFPIRRQKSSLKREIVRSKTEQALENAKSAITNYRVIVSFNDASLVMLEPETGRMHQIRVHLQALHKAVLGDTLYSTRDSQRAYPDIERQMLHALRLEFDFQSTSYVFEAMPGEDFREALESLDGFRGSGYDYEALKSLFSTTRE